MATIKTLKDYLQQATEYRLAADLNITAGAINQAVKKERNIYIVTDDNGISAFELKPAFNTDPDIAQIDKIVGQADKAV